MGQQMAALITSWDIQPINQWGSKAPEKGGLKMRKVIIIGVTFAFLFGVYVCGGTPVVKAQTIDLKFAHFMSPMHIQHQKSFAPFCKKVAELTGGQVKIKIYPEGALGRRMQAHDIIQSFSYLLKPILKETICSHCDFH